MAVGWMASGAVHFTVHQSFFVVLVSVSGLKFESHAVSPQDLIYGPLLIRRQIYLGDSFVCDSAIHE